MVFDPSKYKISVIGLGYVGMPLAVKLAHSFDVVGYDINADRVEELRTGWDLNREIKQAVLRTTSCAFTFNADDIADSNIYIVTVPTPVDDNNNPDLGPLDAASRLIASYLKKEDIVVYESTVYPGITEDHCGALLTEHSALICGEDFFLGYSPERINPGDKVHTVENITKVVAGQTPEVADILCCIYALVTGDNVFRAKDIKTAEASKAIENAQRDINVAFVNEVTIILNKMGLSAYDVLEAAKTKWNFLPFTPGLVGGHCISVDPYYLAQCAKKIGHEPEVILSGRKINDDMGAYVGARVSDVLKSAHKNEGARILVLGFTFKENINDIRNTKAIDVISYLQNQGHEIDVHDPYALKDDVKAHYNIDLLPTLSKSDDYDAAILLVGHDIYKEMRVNVIEGLVRKNGLIFDMKAVWKNNNFSDHAMYLTL